MIEKKWYEKFYENYSNQYDRENFVIGTEKEIDFVEKEIDYNKDIRILDVGCGTGRHSIELAKRGYDVVGFDLSKDQIQKAREKMRKNNLDIKFYVMDATDYEFKNEFDLVLMLCEGGFSLVGHDDLDDKILSNASRALKSSGKLILTAPSAIFQIRYNKNINLKTLREDFEFVKTDDDGNKEKIKANQRYYMPTEIKRRLKELGFTKIDVYDCELGNFRRVENSEFNTFEILVIAER